LGVLRYTVVLGVFTVIKAHIVCINYCFNLEKEELLQKGFYERNIEEGCLKRA
jgi:hypothetical protein